MKIFNQPTSCGDGISWFGLPLEPCTFMDYFTSYSLQILMMVLIIILFGVVLWGVKEFLEYIHKEA